MDQIDIKPDKDVMASGHRTPPKPHRGYSVWINGRFFQAVPYEAEAHGVVARFKADKRRRIQAQSSFAPR